MVVDEHVTDLLPAYALDALEEEETSRIDAHLDICPICQAELSSYQEVTRVLPLSIPQFEPPAYVKERLMERIRLAGSEPIPAQRTFSSPSGQGFPLTWLRSLAPVWSVLSLVIILGLVAGSLLLWQRVNRLQGVVQEGTMRVVNLENTEAVPGASALLVISLDGEHGTLVVDNLPELDDDSQYQLWLVENGERTSGGVFSVSRSGYASLWVASDLALASYDSVGITIEPAGGSPGPTGQRILGGDLP